MDHKVLAVGIDSLNIGFNIERWLEGDTAFERLEDAKQSAGDKLFGGKGVTVNWGDKEFNLLAKGTRGYEYVMFNDDVRLYMAKNCQGGRIYPEVFTQLNSGYLWGNGYDTAYRNCRKWIGEWASIQGEKINRVDLCADLAMNLPILDIKKEIVTRARKKVDYTQIEHYINGCRDTGYRIGQGDLMARIYDKGYEIKGTEKYWFNDIWERGGWDGKSGVTRIEYQARRPYLKGYQINDYEEMTRLLPDIWRYMTCDWLVIKELNISDSNHRRWETSEMWKTVQSVGNQFGECMGVLPYKRKQAKIEPLMDQAKGLLVSVLAIDSQIRGEYHAKMRLRERINNWLDSEELEIKVFERRGRYANL